VIVKGATSLNGIGARRVCNGGASLTVIASQRVARMRAR
jgi:hypothetical protein